jgi:pilus assembly protein Flp/PilA
MGTNLKILVRALRDDERGVTAIEYCMIAGGIALAIVAATQLLGTSLTSSFNDIASNVKP